MLQSMKEFLTQILSSGKDFEVRELKDCCWTMKDTRILGLQRRRIQSEARDEAWLLRAFG